MTDLWTVLEQLLRDLGSLVVLLGGWALQWSLLIVWTAWWLWGVNWSRVWPVLSEGAWAVLLLLMVVSALVWSQMIPADCDCIGVTIPNFWWQLLGISLLTGFTLLCGWVQGTLGWAPAEIDLESAESVANGHGHH